jgi:hypothetical protein
MERLLGQEGDNEDENRKLRGKLPYRQRNVTPSALLTALATGASIQCPSACVCACVCCVRLRASAHVCVRVVGVVVSTRDWLTLSYPFLGWVALPKLKAHLAMNPRLAVPAASRPRNGTALSPTETQREEDKRTCIQARVHTF